MKTGIDILKSQKTCSSREECHDDEATYWARTELALGGGSRSASEPGLLNAPDAQSVDSKETAAQLAVPWKAGERLLCHQGHIKDVEIRTPKHRTCNLLDGHFDNAVNGAIRCVTDQPAIIDEGVPEVAFGTDCRAIGCSTLGSEQD